MLHYTVIVEKGRESGFVAYCPALKGCVSEGRTKKHAVSSLRLAMKDYIECLIEDGLPVPTEISTETVKVAIETA